MYDALTARYTFSCPRRGEAHAQLSDFRALERLPGASHPAVFRIRFACTCGDDHDALLAHDDLDWAPLGFGEGSFFNLMTSNLDSVMDELADLSVRRIQAGQWPWTFFCYAEERARPVFPSSFFLLAPGDRRLGVAVRCPTCTSVSVNLVTAEHVDLPFHNDSDVGVVEHVFAADALRTMDEFSAELYSASFDARRLQL